MLVKFILNIALPFETNEYRHNATGFHRRNVEKLPSDIDSSTTPLPNIVEDLGTGVVCGYWHDGEIIASFLAFDAAKRQKQTSTRVYRAKFAAGCYVKFASNIANRGEVGPEARDFQV